MHPMLVKVTKIGVAPNAGNASANRLAELHRHRLVRRTHRFIYPPNGKGTRLMSVPRPVEIRRGETSGRSTLN